MADYRDFDIEMTIVPDAAGQYEAAFVIHEARGGQHGGKGEEARGAGSPNLKADKRPDGDSGQRAPEGTRGSQKQAGDAAAGRYAFPPVGSYPTPDDAREQTGAWARKWIDLNFPK
ncbi:hypothetical protein [Bordetella genomosp. 11]|uniref:Uncharacterized protein n=1 Tax=Bordetella genomosp. 11 TaxID=1416808 RepID=A0A261UBX2_9BORD|nr:hypothetical protein [Bordetella genomosp. 11]OZI59438.1 hypothetical protein CAL28_07765 [Bordetella genomosp. 11]